MPEIISPIITPFNHNNEIEKDKLKLHAKNLIEKGIDALFVNGTTGLGPSLRKEEKLKNLEIIYDVTNKIIFQVGGMDIEETIELIKASKDYDIIAIASYPLIYYPRIPEEHIIKYFKILNDHSPHPLYLYNYPLATGKDVDAKIVQKIGCIKGVKDTNESIAHSLDYKRFNEGIKVYNGSDMLILTSMSTGLDGSVASSTNYLPELAVKIKQYILNNDKEKAIKLQFLLSDIAEYARSLGSLSANYIFTEFFQGYDIGIPRGPIFELENKKEIFTKLSRYKERLMEILEQ